MSDDDDDDEEGRNSLEVTVEIDVVRQYVCILSHVCCVLLPPCSSSLSPGFCGEAVTGVYADERT